MTDAAEKRSPRIIIGERGGERAEAATEHGARADAVRRVPDALDWKRRFGRRSPLTRKIITFNLIALGMLVAGVLYLNQFQGGFLSLREQSLETEGQLIAIAVREAAGTGDLSGDGRQRALAALGPLTAATGATVRLYGADATFIGSGTPEADSAVAPSATPAVEPPRQSALTAIMGEVWDRASRLVAARRASRDGSLSQAVAPELAVSNPSAAAAIRTGRVARQRLTTRAGETYLAVAVPVLVDGTARGAVVLTTQGGEVDSFVAGERERILQVFALAMMSSIILSFVLANTIVRPLRDLAEAAQRGAARDSKRVNPERIQIPDMTGRPDEIGYLSGAMQMMTTALYDRIEANEQFAADVAHEIKNPLTSLRSAMETFPYARTDDSRAKLLGVMKHDVMRLDRLVTDISNASRLDSELVREEMLEFDLGALLRNLVEYNAASAEGAGATLTADVPEAPLMIGGLEARLAQVFVNLITNAISFAREGDRIVVAAIRDGGQVRVTVTDSGPGIPDENLEDVFSRFYSSRPNQEFGNHSGLGLAISRQIVEAHGGRIWAENVRPEGAGPGTPSQGARFVAELPL
jgi:two-component system sensor histidine kinase ChvG